MPKPSLSWTANDGTLHVDEISATRHEVLAALWKSFPDLKSAKSLVEARLPDLCQILAPMVALVVRDHPEAGNTTRQPVPGVYREDQGQPVAGADLTLVGDDDAQAA